MTVEPWRVTLALHRDSGLVEVRTVGEHAPARRLRWADAMREAVALAGLGATVRVVVLVPAASGTFEKVNRYRIQLPGGRAEMARKREAARDGADRAT